MKSAEEIKTLVRDKYAGIVMDRDKKPCGCGCGGGIKASDYTMLSESYRGKEGYAEEADLGLGCGIPTDHAGIRPGDHVLDLGSGAGNDCFVARALVGENGHVTGLDFTQEMITLAGKNAEMLGYNNVEFVLGDIEQMPFQDCSFDVVISNCVLNLVPDKKTAFSEICRVLKPGGHISVSDVMLSGSFPDKLRSVASLYAGCISGAMDKTEYFEIVRKAGFKNLVIAKAEEIVIPRPFLEEELTDEDVRAFDASGIQIYSISFKAEIGGEDAG